MNKIQIEEEINRLKLAIRKLECQNDNYKVQISELEQEYDDVVYGMKKIFEYVDWYLDLLTLKLTKLDNESVFKETHKKNLQNILRGQQRVNMEDDCNKRKREIIEEINGLEEKIDCGIRKIEQYKCKICQLRCQLEQCKEGLS